MELHGINDSCRAIVVVVIAPVVGFGVIANLAYLTHCMYTWMQGVRAVPIVPIAMVKESFVLGCIAGAFAIPFAILQYKMRAGIVMVCAYLPALTIGVIAAWLTPYSMFGLLTSLVPAWMTFVLCALVSSAIWRNQGQRRDLCPSCGYGLSNLKSPGCPECGWQRTTADDDNGNEGAVT